MREDDRNERIMIKKINMMAKLKAEKEGEKGDDAESSSAQSPSPENKSKGMRVSHLGSIDEDDFKNQDSPQSQNKHSY